MENTEFKKRIKWRRDTSASWAAHDPVLLNGEIIIVDTASGETRFKIGDGMKSFSQLPFQDEFVRSLINDKVQKIDGKGLSSNDYTTAEKTKLAALTQVDAFEDVVVGETTLSADSNHHTFSIAAGSNVTLTPNAETNSVVIAATDTTYNAATQAASGLMSATDKAKLDGIATGANNYTHPTTTGNKHIPSGGSADQILRWFADGTAVWGTDQDTTYSEASTTTAGLMSAADKAKLNQIAAEANKYTLPVAGSEIGGVKSGTDISVDGAGNVSIVNDSHSHGDSTITSLDASKLTGTIPTSVLPSFVDDVLEYSAKDQFPETGESGKIYIDIATNLSYRWGGTTYVEISPSIALGTTSSTAFRGDHGNTAYTHAAAKGTEFASGLYKITTNAQGHVTAATAVSKADITALGIPASDTNTHYTSKNVVGGSATATSNTTAALTNGNVYLISVENGAVTSAHKIIGAGATFVTTDASGNIVVTSTNTTYDAATTSASGLMSAADKTKLNGIATGANKTTVDSALSSTSTNPVQNKVINTALSGKAPSSHTHTKSQITDMPTSLPANGGTAQTISSTLPISKGGTGGTTADAALFNLGGMKMLPQDMTSFLGSGNDYLYKVRERRPTDTDYGDLEWVTRFQTIWKSKLFDKSTSQCTIALPDCNSVMMSTPSYIRSLTNNDNINQTSIGYYPFSGTPTGAPCASGLLEVVNFNNDVVQFIYGNNGNYYRRGTATNISAVSWTKVADASNMNGATSSTAGSAGLVPAPAAGKQASFLRGDGSWVVPTNTTYSNFVKSGSGAKSGLVPAPSTTAGTSKYLREDGTWAVPPNTTYSAASTSAAGLMSAADKTKLNGIATGANKTTVDSAMSSSSTNPVQNKVVNSAITAKQNAKKSATNVSVATSAWSASTTYTDYPFQATVTVSGGTATMFPEVVFNLAEASSGNFAPIAQSAAGGVIIYAKAKPTAAITIPTVIMWP